MDKATGEGTVAGISNLILPESTEHVIVVQVALEMSISDGNVIKYLSPVINAVLEFALLETAYAAVPPLIKLVGVGVIWKVLKVLAFKTVIEPPVPLSRSFPAEFVIAIVNEPHAAFVLLGLVNLLYENVKSVVFAFEEVITDVSESEDTDAELESYIKSPVGVGIVIFTNDPAGNVDL